MLPKMSRKDVANWLAQDVPQYERNWFAMWELFRAIEQRRDEFPEEVRKLVDECRSTADSISTHPSVVWNSIKAFVAGEYDGQ